MKRQTAHTPVSDRRHRPELTLPSERCKTVGEPAGSEASRSFLIRHVGVRRRNADDERAPTARAYRKRRQLCDSNDHLAGGLLALTTLGIGALAEPVSALAPVEGNEAFQDPAADSAHRDTRATASSRVHRAGDPGGVRKGESAGEHATRRSNFFGAAIHAFPDMDALAECSRASRPVYDLETDTDDFADIDLETGTITFYKNFFDTSENSPLEQDRKRFDPPLSAEQWQAMVVLHEILHLFGKDHDDSDESVRQYEDPLAKECFNSSKPKPPDPPPAPGRPRSAVASATAPSAAPCTPCPSSVSVERPTRGPHRRQSRRPGRPRNRPR